MKLHYQSDKPLRYAPTYLREKYEREGKDGAICGYVRKVTKDKDKVTCLLCLAQMNKTARQEKRLPLGQDIEKEKNNFK